MRPKCILFLLVFLSLSVRIQAGRPAKQLAGMLSEVLAIEEIHPDSVYPYIQRIENLEIQTADAEQRVVCQLALARLYSERAVTAQYAGHEGWVGLSKQKFLQVFAQSELLARMRAASWVPVVKEGSGDEFFADDMLSVAWRTLCNTSVKSDSLPTYGDMIEHYTRQGKRRAAFLLAKDSLWAARVSASQMEGALLALRDRYADLDDVAQLYIPLSQCQGLDVEQRKSYLVEGLARYPKYKYRAELQNALLELTDPTFQWKGTSLLYPGKQYPWQFRVRNIGSVDFQGQRHAFPQGASDVAILEDSLLWTAPTQVGTFRINFLPRPLLATETKVEPIENKFRVSRLQLLSQPLPGDSLRLIVTDRQTGQPMKGVLVELFDNQSDDDSSPRLKRRTDQRGVAEIHLSSRMRGRLGVRLSTTDETDLPRQSLYAYASNRSQGSPWRALHLYSDRAIYRPGQQARVAVLTYERSGWDGFAYNCDSVELTLMDGQRKQVEQKCVAVDSLGVATALFQLPSDRRLGRWRIQARAFGKSGRKNDEPTTSTVIRVEQYKRPTFDVLFDDSLQFDTVRLFAKRYDGTPLRNARVTGRYSYNHGLRWGEGDAVAVDTFYTDAQGRLGMAIPRDTSAYSLNLTFDVLAPYGEQQQAKHTYRLRPWRPEPQKQCDSTFLVVCLQDTFDLAQPARLELHTDREQLWVYYTLAAQNRVWLDTLMCIPRGTTELRVPYDTCYGGGASACFATVVDERTFTKTTNLMLRQPDKHLRLHWDTFRDRTKPGEREQWRLTLLRPDGQPACGANVMATLYDASLDRLVSHDWRFNYSMSYNLSPRTFHQVSMPSGRGVLYANYLQKREKVPAGLTFACLNDDLFGVNAGGHSPVMFKSMALASRAMVTDADVKEEATMPMLATSEVQQTNVIEAKTEDAALSDEDTDEKMAALPVRENFQETAYFVANLRTDARGRTTMDFTLPESTTTWRLRGLAHTRDLLHLTFGEEIVAQKSLMAQLRLPRFLRVGDEAVVHGSLTNNSDQSQQVKALLQVTNRRTGQTVLSQSTAIRLEAHTDTTLAYLCPAVGGDSLLVRWTAQGQDCTDGEQQVLCVEPAGMEVTNTLPFTVEQTGRSEYSLETLFPEDATQRELRVEYTACPDQYALHALPALTQPRGSSVLSYAAAYYATRLAQHLGLNVPDSAEALRLRVAEMQRNDGGISWYPGMPSSRYISLEVATLLARLGMLTGRQTDGLLLQSITRYLLNDRSRVEKMSDTEALRTLYVVQRSGVTLGKAERRKTDSLVSVVKQLKPEELDVEQQALCAIVLKEQGMDARARHMVEAFLPRLVERPNQGTCIEWPQGPWRSIDRKLDAHVQMMEALHEVIPGAKQLPGMRRHLLCQKRTQVWDTPVHSANAIFALCQGMGDRKQGSGTPADVLSLTVDGQRTPINMVASGDSLGIVSQRIQPVTSARSLSVQKFSPGESWGAVMATFRQSVVDVEADTTGLAVRQGLPSEMKVGQCVKVMHRLMADADYEYVTLRVPRPAALEPVEQLSGCRWTDGLCYYMEVTDTSILYHVLSVPRGHYRLSTEYYVERPGVYHTGVATVVCTLAPEFQGRDSDGTLVIKE